MGRIFCCCMFSQLQSPQVAPVRVLAQAFQAPQHEGRASSDRPTLAHMRPGQQHNPDFGGKKMKTSKAESFHEWNFSPGCCKILSPVHSETLGQNCQCWHMRRWLPLAEQPSEYPPCGQGLWAWSCWALKNPIWIIKPWQESIPACGSTCRNFSLLPLKKSALGNSCGCFFFTLFAWMSVVVRQWQGRTPPVCVCVGGWEPQPQCLPAVHCCWQEFGPHSLYPVSTVGCIFTRKITYGGLLSLQKPSRGLGVTCS